MPVSTALIFVVLALSFGVLAARDYWRRGSLSLAGRVWMRIAVIFAAVALVLSLAIPTGAE